LAIFVILLFAIAFGIILASLRSELEKRAQNLSDLEIEDPTWLVSEFGVATWQLQVRNRSKTSAYKDIHFHTKYYGESGTLIDQSIIGQTQYRTILPGESIFIKFDEFTSRQAAGASIIIDRATAEMP